MTLLLDLAIAKKLKNFELDITLQLNSAQGRVLALFGPSGSGKTTTINCIAGIIDPDSGYIAVAEQVLFDSKNAINLKSVKRQIGYLPQNYGLFPHLTVEQNIAFGLFAWDKAKTKKRVAELIQLIQLQGLEKRYPRQLSGGQQQRVALARALAPNPKLLLLDEPFSALDSNIRQELRMNLSKISRDLQLPAVFITHDLEEAFIMADYIAVYNQGRILQYGSRNEIFYQPNSVTVAKLLGLHNLWQGRVLEVQPNARLIQVRTLLADWWAQIPLGQPLPQIGQVVTLCVRPENIKLSGTKPDTNALNWAAVDLLNEMARGSLYTLFLKLQTHSDNQPELELEITAQDYADFRRAGYNSWYMTINPATIWVIFS